MPSLACPWPPFRSAVPIHAAASCSHGATRGRVPEWAQLKGVRRASSGLSHTGTHARQLQGRCACSPECHVHLHASSGAAALPLPDNCPTFGQWESPRSSHTRLRGATGGVDHSSWLQDLARLFSPSMGQLSSIPWDLRWPQLLRIPPPLSKGSCSHQGMSSCYFPGQCCHHRGLEIASMLCLCLWPSFDNEMFGCNSWGIF